MPGRPEGAEKLHSGGCFVHRFREEQEELKVTATGSPLLLLIRSSSISHPNTLLMPVIQPFAII